MINELPGMTLIAGCGVSGRAAARLAARLGIPFALLDEQDNDSLRTFAASLPKQPEAVYFGFHAQDEHPHFERTVWSPGFRAGNPVRAKLAGVSGHLLSDSNSRSGLAENHSSASPGPMARRLRPSWPPSFSVRPESGRAPAATTDTP